ncbi:GDP-mannose 4,6-dehydratase [Vibrio vulnificus]|uniref:GDP-mannose 4,6-dehydratase n=1 Tax=Vibrio vulnificus TaxID=672 RepID=UPI001EEBD6D7|nr:GDP-mannose 4,6-dehydratase [Vibrio vulnificus]MCG6270848.1 GDP-mannose 4,6-dehydratase [Vibrio vulnificus]MCU8185773.1 GDP-mannose 4,6-dehydratase [Vibrio vulnificus]
MKVYVTGANGFAGKYLVEQLLNIGYEVFCAKSRLEDYEGIKAELSEFIPDYVIHLGASSFVANSNVSGFYTVNVLGTRNLLQAIKFACPNILKVILTSSAAVYGNCGVECISENVKPTPSNDYGVSKLAMEYVANLFCSDIPIVITRPFNFTGVGQSTSFVIPKIIEHFKSRKSKIELGNINVYREFGDVRDFTSHYIGLLEKEVLNQVVNVCTGNVYSLTEVLHKCENITGWSIEVETSPSLLRAGEIQILGGDPTFLFDLVKSRNAYELDDTLSWMLS